MGSFVNLDGTRLLVIGANSGIGLTATEMAAADGAQVAAAVLPGSAAGLPKGCTRLECDVTDPASVDACIAAAVAALGRLDGVILTAGMFDHRGVAETSDADWARIMQLNLNGPFHVARALEPVFRAQGSGALVLFSSQIGLVGHRRATGYAASKAAVNGLARTLAIEFAPFGARVNAVAPGPIETPMTAVARSDAPRAKALVDAVPLGRFGRAEEPAAAALFLVSPAASYITGHVLVVDGGVTAI